ncbi:MAG: hypothetical protein MUE95_11490 [Cyclobacteriaceae bacterium]|jgi:hypothetical protein|nr:hypothetical protein [Cyclobacteriaceae bacterium]
MKNAIFITCLFLAGAIGSPAMAATLVNASETVAIEYDELVAPRDGQHSRQASRQIKFIWSTIAPASCSLPSDNSSFIVRETNQPTARSRSILYRNFRL